MKNVLFICGKARKRSPTAARVALNWPEIDADFAGLSRDADEHVTPEHLDWADVIFVMESRQKKRLTSALGSPKKNAKVIVLDIPDRYEFMGADLVEELTQKLAFHFGAPEQ